MDEFVLEMTALVLLVRAEIHKHKGLSNNSYINSYYYSHYIISYRKISGDVCSGGIENDIKPVNGTVGGFCNILGIICMTRSSTILN